VAELEAQRRAITGAIAEADPALSFELLVRFLELADGVSDRCSDTTGAVIGVFRRAVVRREAMLSSQIEGTQSSLSDLLLFELEEAPGAPFDDVVEVSSYVAGLEHGLTRLAGGFPVSSRLLREIHARLLARGRGADRLPGEFRRSQNWIGGTRPGNARFVAPPPGLVEECMGQLEQFIHGGTQGQHGLPVLVRAALFHVQFETINPFLDGNG
jgi:Fic family protein